MTGSRDTERLRLRDLRLDDEAALISAWVNSEVEQFMDDYGPRTADQVRRWLREAIEASRRDDRVFGWAIELKHTGEVVGWIGFGRSARGVAEMDFAYVVAPPHRGLGYAPEALAAVVSFCFEELGVSSVWGECAVDNARSAGVMTRAGLLPAGVVEGQSRFVLART